MKFFLDEIRIMLSRLVSGSKFSFSKYADGEWMAINGIHSFPGEGEWIINPVEYADSIEMLKNSFIYKDKDYYVGISCPCCQGNSHYEMKQFSGQDESNLTFANIFVNSNYSFFRKNFIPYFSRQKNIYLVANKITNLNNLPFYVEKFYPIDYNAWIVNKELINIIKEDVKNLTNKLFLFSAGPFGNILAHQLWQINKENQYIDIGSTIDPWTKANKILNKYYSNNDFFSKTCTWG